MKRILIIVEIIFIVFLIITNYSQASGMVSLSTNKNSVYVGDEFLISVNLSEASVATLTIRISIDTSKVEYISGPSNSNFSNGKVIYTWTDPNGGLSPISSGTIVAFKFKAKSKGIANFSITGDFYDVNENAINPSFSGKSVTINEVTIPSTPSTLPIEGNSDDEIFNSSNNTISESDDTITNISLSLSNNAYLKSLRLNVEGVSPKFNKNTIQYYMTLANSVDSIDIVAIPENDKAKVVISGNTALKTGLNKILISVTAQDGKTNRNYIINATKTDNINKSNANLENLAIENCKLIPDFNTEIMQYTCELQDDLSKLKILAVSENENAKVEIIGNQNLKIGENLIKINVTAQDGTTMKIYEIKVNKAEIKKIEENTPLPIEESQIQSEKINSNRAVIPLVVVGIVAIIDGICYKKFWKKQ